jgi:hypothetical protein
MACLHPKAVPAGRHGVRALVGRFRVLRTPQGHVHPFQSGLIFNLLQFIVTFFRLMHSNSLLHQKNKQTMIYAAITLFALAAILGISILIRWLSNQDASRTVIYSHGLVAATGLVLLIVYSLQHPENFPQVSLILFILGALGGFYLFFTNTMKKTRPVAVAFVHALLAVTAFITLLVFAFAY